MSLPAFSVSWTTPDGAWRFQSPDALTLPDGQRLCLPLAAWLRLRDVLRLLPDEPAAAPAGAFAADLGEEQPAASRRPGPANRGKPWTAEEEERAHAAWSAGDDAADIARALGRSRGAVMARLVRLGLVDEAEAGLRYPTQGAGGAGSSRPPAEPEAPIRG